MPDYAAAATVVDRLIELDSESVLRWGCPVPYFGRLSQARIATVGINPSGREFMDGEGNELDGQNRRLPTLRSLGLRDWSEADASHLRTILISCDSYFDSRPYDRWFRVLDAVLDGHGSTYYGKAASACHLDLVPYATAAKWGSLDPGERRRLLEASCSAIGLFLRDSPIEILVLNGRSVVEEFQRITGAMLESSAIPSWALPRADGRPVPGIAYSGVVDHIGEIDLHRSVRVVGYNHNLQSSFGVTGHVLRQIREWIKSAETAHFE
jgi:hypothetical protein